MTQQFGLGRVRRFDPRSLAYTVKPRGAIRSVEWERRIPILDQGNLGSCTGNAGTGILGTEPFVSQLHYGTPLDESYAVDLYSAATQLDGDSDNYPPTDSGSDGNAVAKALRNRGLISGWTHVTDLAAAHTAIQDGPFITGVNWYNGMFEPDADGIVTLSGPIAGGHEIEVVGYDATRGLWKIANSWGAGWGKAGYFYWSDATYARLLSEDGDATPFTPITEPAPTPDPAANPLAEARTILDPWAAAKHIGTNGAAARAWKKYVSALR